MIRTMLALVAVAALSQPASVFRHFPTIDVDDRASKADEPGPIPGHEQLPVGRETQGLDDIDCVRPGIERDRGAAFEAGSLQRRKGPHAEDYPSSLGSFHIIGERKVGSVR